MTTMELHMNNLDSGIASDDSNSSLGKDSGVTSEVKLAPNGAPNTNARGDLKRKSVFDSTYVKPLGILAAFLLIGLLILAFKALTPEEVVRTVDGGDASTIRVNRDLDGRAELNADQAKYLSDRDRAEAAKNAREGVSSVPIVDRAEVTTDFTTYDVTAASDSSAVTQSYQTIPKTVAQLDAENLAAQGDLYSKGVDNNNHIVFTNKKTGQLIVPIDKVLAEGFVDKSNATYNTNNNANDGSQNQGGNQGGNNQGGNNQGGQGQGDASQQQVERQPDPMIESKRAQLSADYEAFQAQQAALDAKEQQLAQDQQQRYQQQQEFRSDVASQSLNDSLSQIKNSVGSRNSYTALSYNAAATSSQGAGTGTQANVAYNPSAQNLSQGASYSQPTTSQQYSNPTAQNNYAGYLSNGGVVSQPNQQPVYNNADLNDKTVEYDENGNIVTAGTSAATTTNNSSYSGSNGASNGLNVGFSQSGQSGNSSTTYNSSQTGEVLDQRLPANIIRAGTKWQAILTKPINTDEGLQAIGELVTGRFAGSTIYGTVQLSGKNIGVQFNAIAPRNSRKPIIPIASYATTIGEQKTALSKNKDINNHYVRNYGIKGLSSVLRGIGEAYDGAGETSVVTDTGTVITTKESTIDADAIRADVLGELGKDLTADISKIGNRVPTYKIPMGVVVNVVLSSDLDINNTTSTITQDSQAR